MARQLLLFILAVSSVIWPIKGFSQTTEKPYSQWNFRISPYFWFVGLEGTIYRPPTPPLPIPLPEPRPPHEIDVSFQDISSNIKFAFMGAGEFRYKWFVTQFNVTSIILEGKAITPADLVLQDLRYRFSYVSGDLGAGYFIIKNDKLEVSALLGLKYIYFNIGGVTSIGGSLELDNARSFNWTDPILAIRLKYLPHPRVEIAAYGDTDGNLIGKVFNYQFIGLANFAITKWFVFSAGYRLWGVKADGPEALYSGEVKGAVVRLGFQF